MRMIPKLAKHIPKEYVSGEARDKITVDISFDNLIVFSLRKVWPHRLAWSRTLGSQPINTGSNPVGATSKFSLF